MPDKGWRLWLKNQLEKNGFDVESPAMPNPDHPKMEEWVSHLSETVGTVDKDCYFIGHSLGCITILRYIESLKPGQHIGGAVLVAGFTNEIAEDKRVGELKPFYSKPIQWEKIKGHCKKFVVIHSDNDMWIPLKHGYIFKEKLNAELVIEHARGHFRNEDGILELPSALEAVLRMSR